ncbi:MAG: hypothetical protein A2144_03340 [Chloroflexi bacterium RBG_16_50_9]|nr:MAG: hypothetical protein A2144_03340 [Chloroflexi bacterium RBG_16_50_9]
MPRFIAVHTLPYTEAQFMEMLKQPMPKPPRGVAWKQTYCSFADHKFFCEWESPDKEAIEQTFKAMNMPFEAIHPVRLFDVAKKKLEK